MSNYKAHAIAGIIMAMPFVPNAFYLFFALIGASICDLDHDNNRKKVSYMLLTGITLSVILFFFNASSLSALLLIILAIIFYISKHRGFTHTILGVILLSALFLLMFMGFISFFSRVFFILGLNLNHSIILLMVMAIVGFFVISRRYYVWYLLLCMVSLVIQPLDYVSLNWMMVFIILFVGCMSHLILDLLTPAGLTLFKPFSSVECHKKIAYAFILLWLALSLYVICSNAFVIT